MNWIKDIYKPQTRQWEEFYRNRWQHDRVVRMTQMSLPRNSSPLTRRRFLSRLSIILGSITAAMVVIPSVGFLLGLRKTPQIWRSVGFRGLPTGLWPIRSDS